MTKTTIYRHPPAPGMRPRCGATPGGEPGRPCFLAAGHVERGQLWHVDAEGVRWEEGSDLLTLAAAAPPARPSFEGVKRVGCERSTCGPCRALASRWSNTLVAVTEAERAALEEAVFDRPAKDPVRLAVQALLDRLEAARTRCSLRDMERGR